MSASPARDAAPWRGIPVKQPIEWPEPSDRVIVAEGLGRGLRIARRFPGSRVDIFEPNWALVDHGRALLAGLGLDDRVSLHHGTGRAIAERLCGARGLALSSTRC